MSLAIATQTDTQNHFSELVEQHRGIVNKVVGMYCWHPDDHDELSQEIIAQLWRAFTSYDDRKRFSTWMYRVALNVSISWVRRNSIRQRHTIQFDEDVHPAVDTTLAPDDDGRMAFLQNFIDELDPLNRALMLLYLDERSYRDIAEILGISETNVATRINRLKQRVRKQSAEINGEGEENGTR